MRCDDNAGAIELFAECCETLNEFSRKLWENPAFGEVRVGADIRNYESGWRLEKYVEAAVDAKKGMWAAWWLELGQRDGNWVVETNVSVSHADVYLEFPERIAMNIQELKAALEQAVAALTNSIDKDHDFFREIERLHES